tara:strand:+ start:1509 stop:1823 length:315 start_codon:yes stop_codon:yes gene_type:complete
MSKMAHSCDKTMEIIAARNEASTEREDPPEVVVTYEDAGPYATADSRKMWADREGLVISGWHQKDADLALIRLETDDENNVYDIIDLFISSLQDLRAKAKESGL